MDFLNQASKRVRSTNLAFEILFFTAINLVFFFLFSKFDVFESLYQYSRQYEVYELDEVVPMLFTISLTLFIFASRRRKENRALSKLFDELSVVDSSTGLYNREYFLNTLTNELERSYRSGNDLTLVLMKVDGLAQPVEEQEDITARQVVLELAKIAEACSRDIDMITRWDFDELLILCRDTRLEGAEVLCSKILENFRTFQFPEMGKIKVRVGVASAVEERNSIDLVSRAQEKLRQKPSRYENKKLGSIA